MNLILTLLLLLLAKDMKNLNLSSKLLFILHSITFYPFCNSFVEEVDLIKFLILYYFLKIKHFQIYSISSSFILFSSCSYSSSSSTSSLIIVKKNQNMQNYFELQIFLKGYFSIHTTKNRENY